MGHPDSPTCLYSDNQICPVSWVRRVYISIIACCSEYWDVGKAEIPIFRQNLMSDQWDVLRAILAIWEKYFSKISPTMANNMRAIPRGGNLVYKKTGTCRSYPICVPKNLGETVFQCDPKIRECNDMMTQKSVNSLRDCSFITFRFIEDPPNWWTVGVSLLILPEMHS